MPSRAFPPRHVDPMAAHPASNDSDEEDEEEEVDLVMIMNEMTTAERRRVYALKGLMADYNAVRSQLRDELAQLQLEHHNAVKRLHDIRNAIVLGTRDITPEEVAKLPADAAASSSSAAEKPSAPAAEGGKKKKGVKVMAPGDESASKAVAKAGETENGGIPDFWLTALENTEVFSGMITERDRPALRHLMDITSTFIDDDPRKGVVLTFSFSKNEFFTDATLVKTYHMEFNEEDNDIEIGKIEGCPIHWTSPKSNLTVVVKQKKQRNKNTKQVRVVEKEEKCDSFFNFFTPPKEPSADDKDDSDADDEDDEFYEQEVEMDIEAGQALMEEVVPKAAYYYTGKSVEDVAKELQKQFGFGLLGDDDEEDEEEESEEDDSGDEGGAAAAGGVNFRAMVQGRGGAGAGRGGAGRGGAAGQQPPQQQECKQQ